MPETLRVGSTEIRAVRDADFRFIPTAFIPNVPPEGWRAYLGAVDPTKMGESRVLTFVIRSQGKTILVDACSGDHKDRRRPFFHRRQWGWLEKLEAAGAKPEDAFYVRVGLGTTMTAQDILEGRMNVEIGIAAIRPAEFIILRFSHKMQEA